MSENNTPSLEKVKQILRRLRNATRRETVLYGICLILTALGVWFWSTLFLDKAFEPSQILRGILLAASFVWFARYAYIHIISPWIRPLSEESMAQLCAQTFPQDSELILTAISPSDPDGQNGELWLQTCLKAESRAEELLKSGRISTAFNQKNVWKARGVTGLFILSLVGLNFWNPAYIPLWFNRVVCLSNQLWPRQAKIWVDGFDKSANNPVGRIKIAKGDDLDLRVFADVTRSVVPSRVTMDYRDANGYRKTATMIRQGEYNPQSTTPLAFTYTLRGALNSLCLDFHGADAQLKGLYIDVVESPVIVKAQLKLSYPEYMNKKDRVIPVTASAPVPFGVKAALVLTPNKPIKTVYALVTGIDGKAEKKSVVFIPQSNKKAVEPFELNLGECKSEQNIVFSLLDTDGLKSRKDAAFTIAITPDAVPVPTVIPKGLGVACTINASIPVSGSVIDDYGVSFARFAYTITRKEQKISGFIPVSDWQNRPLETPLAAVFEPAKANVQLDDSLTLWMEFGDGYNLPDKRNPNVGQTPQTILEIVTPQRMRMILEAAELNLRRHFETVFEEVKSTKELAAAISTQEENPADASIVPLAVRILHADRAVQNARKNMQEFLAEAEAFENLVDQMVNNKIDTPEWKNRLHDGIAQPLVQIANTSFIELEKRLLKLRKALESSDWQNLPKVKTAAMEQYDITIRQLDEVLAKMLQMEDFNEAVELLRSIIKKQDAMESDMKQQQKESLQDLL